MGASGGATMAISGKGMSGWIWQQGAAPWQLDAALPCCMWVIEGAIFLQQHALGMQRSMAAAELTTLPKATRSAKVVVAIFINRLFIYSLISFRNIT